jgi:stage II sporulation protein AA (anti-sigma F factor antagonist)
MVQSTQKDGNLVFEFSGRMDSAECTRIEGEVVQPAQTIGRPVVFDLARVDFVASAFLRLCLMVQQKAGGNQLTLVNLNPTIKKVFKIAGLDKMMAR